MQHRINKIKFKKGQDSNQAVMRKLVVNFIEHGKLETTLKRAKAVKSAVDRLTYKSLTKSESSKNVLLSKLGNKKTVDKMFNEVGPAFKVGTGGFVRMIRIGKRQGDNAEVAQLMWSKDIFPKVAVDTNAKAKKQSDKNGSKIGRAS